MKLLPITLGLARPETKGAGKSVSGGGKKPAALSPVLKNKILERDKNTCRFCGFVSEKYQEVQALNHDLTDDNPKNLATACIFCHQCFHLESVGAARSGVLLWLPELEQAQLSNLARTIYVARISQGPVAETARKTLDILMARKEEAKKRISTDDPAILATILSDYLGPGAYKMRGKKLNGVRLFPLDRRIVKESELEFNQFPQILAYWRSKKGPFSGRQPQNWPGLYKDIVKAA